MLIFSFNKTPLSLVFKMNMSCLKVFSYTKANFIVFLLQQKIRFRDQGQYDLYSTINEWLPTELMYLLLLSPLFITLYIIRGYYRTSKLTLRCSKSSMFSTQNRALPILLDNNKGLLSEQPS